MIKAINLQKSYGKKQNKFQALKDIDLEIKNGESVAIIGKSGSGKSTLMHILAGLDKPTHGEVWLNDQNIGKMKAKKLAHIRNKNFGFIFQQFFLMPKLSVLDNVALPLKIGGVSAKKRREKALKALEEVGLTDKSKSRANDLSGGQKQRVAIARALVTEPEVIFADEPTGNLDTVNGKNIMEILMKLNKEKNITIIMVTHDLDLAKQCKRQIHIKDGEIVKA